MRNWNEKKKWKKDNASDTTQCFHMLLGKSLGPVLWGEPHHSIQHGSKSLQLPTSNFHNAQVLVLGLKSAGCWDASPNWRERMSFPGRTSVLRAILHFSSICLCYQSPVRIKWPSVHKHNDDDEHMDWPELQSHIVLHC